MAAAQSAEPYPEEIVDHKARAAIGGPACWIGSDLARDRSWIWPLDGAEVAAIEAALVHAT